MPVDCYAKANQACPGISKKPKISGPRLLGTYLYNQTKPNYPFKNVHSFQRFTVPRTQQTSSSEHIQDREGLRAISSLQEAAAGVNHCE